MAKDREDVGRTDVGGGMNKPGDGGKQGGDYGKQGGDLGKQGGEKKEWEKPSEGGMPEKKQP